jgi:CHAD domain-containing protein
MHRALLATPAPLGARLVARDLLTRIRDASVRLDDPADEEALHDTRVNIRRLRSVLRAYAPALRDTVGKKWRRRLGEIARETNAGRDAEVHLGWLRDRLAAGEVSGTEAIHRVEAELQQRMQSEYGAIRSDIRDKLHRADGRLRRRLSFYAGRISLDGAAVGTETFGRVTGELLQRHADQMWSLLSGVTSAEAQTRIHDGRVAVKRLRYLLEPLRKELPRVKELTRWMKQLQDVLGELNDMFVLLDNMRSADQEGRQEGGAGGLAHDAVEMMIAAAERQRDERYRQLEAMIADGSLARFVERVHRLGTELALESRVDLRRWRLFLLSGLPAEVKRYPVEDVSEGWIVDRGLRDHLVKVVAGDNEHRRRIVERVPDGEVLVEQSVGEEVFQRLWRLTRGRRLRRRRYAVAADEHPAWRIDKLAGSNLVLGAVEAAPDGTPPAPDWIARLLVRDVTDDPAFASVALAR